MKTITMLAAAGCAFLGAGVAAPAAHADGTQASAEQAVQQLYTQVQQGCTPSMAPSFQRIVWDVPFDGEAGSGGSSTPTRALVARSPSHSRVPTLRFPVQGWCLRSRAVTGTSTWSSADAAVNIAHQIAAKVPMT